MSEFHDIVQRIEALTSPTADFAELVQQMQRLARLCPRSFGNVIPPGLSVYRGTNHHKAIPGRIEDLWYPPSQHVGFGRANRPGSPVFYCCSDPAGAFREIGTRASQYAILAEWVTTARMIVHPVGYTGEVLRRANSRRVLPQQYATFDSSLPAGELEVREYLALAFTDPTTERYRITAAIAEGMYLATEGLAGLMYPALEKNANVDNLALRPSVVHTGLLLKTAKAVYVNKVEEVVSGGDIGGSIIAKLAGVRDGNLEWEYTNRRATTIPAHSSAAVQLKPREWKMVTSMGRLGIDGRQYDVLPGYRVEMINGELMILDLLGSRVPPVA